MLLENEKEEIQAVVRETLQELTGSMKTSLTESIKNAIAEERADRPLTRKDIMAVKNKRDRQKLIAENMELFK